MPPDPLVAVVLAAGASRRMGRPKPLLELGGRPLVARHVDALAAAGARVRVVVGAAAAEVERALPGHVEVVRNADWARTDPAASLALALRDLPAGAAVLVAPVDTPPAPRAVLDALLAAGPPAVPVHAGRPGHPVLVRAGAARAVLRRGGTLRDALRRARRVPVDWPDAALDFDTPAEWAAWRGDRS